MYGLLFKNRFYALLFVVFILFGVRELVGTEEEEGAISKAVATIEDRKPAGLTVGPREERDESGGPTWGPAPGGGHSSRPPSISSDIVVPVPVGESPVLDGPVGGAPPIGFEEGPGPRVGTGFSPE